MIIKTSLVRCSFKITKSRPYRFIKCRNLSQSTKKSVILGIETSCDDTGCAIVDSEGNLLGDALHSQHLLHLNNGGIIPPLAQDLHRWNIERVVNDAIKQANVSFDQIDAVAATVKPGMPRSLEIGMKYGKYLCTIHNKPFIPIHHMEAHALTARMFSKDVEFPFLVLLISGGHCLLAIVRGVDDFLLMGQTLNNSPGEVFDKIARRMKLRNIAEYSRLSGGKAVELAASYADNPGEFKFTTPLLHYRDCNFSFSGLKNAVQRVIERTEKELDLPPDGLIPNFSNVCAGFQFQVTTHICHRVQRAIEYIRMKELILPDKRTLVVSGGVACNNFIARGLKIVCDQLDYRLVRPPPKLCTDNGVMIAWNGVERWRERLGVTQDLKSANVQQTCSLGVSIIDDVSRECIKTKWIKLDSLLEPQSKIRQTRVANVP